MYCFFILSFSFPTVFLVKAGTDTPINFNGDRTVDGLIEFIKEHVSVTAETGAQVKEEL